jgi:Double zinc ribbon
VLTRATALPNVARLLRETPALSPSPSSAADDLDRLFRRAVANLAALDPSRVHGPVDVAELYERLVPYRTHRTTLGMDTHEDYEMALLRLLAGERGYAFVEPEAARTALAAEATSVNPDTGLYKKFRSASVTFDPGLVHAALGEEGAEDAAGPLAEPPAPPAARSEREPAWFPEISDETPEPGPPEHAEPREEEEEEEVAADELPFALEDGDEGVEPPGATPRQGSAPCAFCGGALPFGRAVIYCPHCGQNVGVVHCPSCGTELDVGWKFCITCGRQMGELA